ncbi:unnamed protein product [Polarella glacialis]|uniref:Glycosyltransferase 2-like domain-containing protein n=1 Tax=Polarella glacialis TaxID=89957 RepID=A0A813IM63_POLGL|nr:unnamed protein product [Polarella glacialis]
MDADDRSTPDRFAQLLQALQDHPDWVGACTSVHLFGTVSEGMLRYIEWQNALLSPEELLTSRFVEIPALHQSGLYPKALLWEQLEGYRDLPGWPIDIDTWMRLAEFGARVGKIPGQLYGWRQHVLQSTRNHGRCSLEKLRRCKAHFLLRSLPAQVRCLEVWSTGGTLGAWAEALRAELDSKLLDSPPELRLVDWRPKGGRRRGGAAKRKEGSGGGAAARATVKTEAERDAEMAISAMEASPLVGTKRTLNNEDPAPQETQQPPLPATVESLTPPASSPEGGEATARVLASGLGALGPTAGALNVKHKTRIQKHKLPG